MRVSLGGASGPAALADLGLPATGVDNLQASLNGDPVTLPAAGIGTRRVLNLAELGRLRFGANRLRVRLLMTDGAVQAVSRTFTLSGHRDIAAAKVSTPAAAGRSLLVDANRSLLVPGTGGLATAHWTLARRPELSRAQLGSATGARVALRPDVPGDYQIALRVGTGSATGVDLLNENVRYPEALVPFNTIAYDHSEPPLPGIQIEKSFYPDPGLGALQILVLHRTTLAPDSTHGIPNPNIGVPATAAGFQNALSTLRAHLTTGDLVIITHPGGDGVPAIPPALFDTLEQILGTVGGNMAGQWRFGRSDCWSGATDLCYGVTAKWSQAARYGGSFTVIGVKGMPVGQAWRETAAQLGGQDGRITGYFTGATGPGGGTQNYTVVNGPDPYVTVNTCVGTANPWCAVKVGAKTYPAESGVGGLHIVVLDRTTLTLISNTTATSFGQAEDALQSPALPGVGDQTGPPGPSADDQRLVIIQSVGDHNGVLHGTIPQQWLTISNQFGATPEYLWDATRPAGGSATKGCRYALIGTANKLPWQGTAAESSTAMRNGPDVGTSCQTPQNGQPTGRLDGVLQRGRDGLYTPVGGAAAGATDTALYQILYSPGWYRPDQAWPMDNDVTGLSYVADKLGLCTPTVCYPDVRSAYTLALDWNDLRHSLDRLPDNCNPTQCGRDFPELQEELSTEFHWVNQVHALIANLKAPYGQATSDFNVKTVYNKIKDNYPISGGKDVTMQWLNIFAALITIGQNVVGVTNPIAGAVFGVAAAAGTLASQSLISPKGGPLDSVTAAADKLGDEMLNLEKGYLQWTDLAENILDSTYQQLKAAGSTLWGWDRTTTPKMVTALDGSATAAAYSALLPAAWGGYNLKPGSTLPGSDDVATYTCAENGASGKIYREPFKPSQPANRYSALTNLNNGAPTFQVWTFANTSGFRYNQAPSAAMPNGTVTDYIYGEHATTAATASNGWESGAYQYEPSWWRSTYNPPSHTICNRSNPNPNNPQTDWSTAYGSPPNDIPQQPPS